MSSETNDDDSLRNYGDPADTESKKIYFKIGVVVAVSVLLCVVIALTLFAFLYIRSLIDVPLIKPRKLNGRLSTVGLISPSSPYSQKMQNTTEYLERIQQELITSLNFSQVLLGPHMSDVWGFLAGTDSNRSADVNLFFGNQSVHFILSNRGGYGCNRILNMLDYAAIARNPKGIMGYSDLTALLNAILFQTGLVTFHGPMGIDSLAPSTLNAQYMSRILFGNELVEYRNTPERTIKTLNSGKAKGRLVGGNLSVFVSLLGTKFLPPNSRFNIRWEDVILFFEDVSESSQTVDRMLSSLANNGILDKVAGVVWGTCVGCSQSVPLEEILRQHLKMPAFMNATIGHDGDQWTIPLGVLAEMDADAGTIRLLEPAMSD